MTDIHYFDGVPMVWDGKKWTGWDQFRFPSGYYIARPLPLLTTQEICSGKGPDINQRNPDPIFLERIQ